MNTQQTPTPRQVVEKIRELGLQDDIQFLFVPNEALRNRVMRCGDPIVDKLASKVKEAILLCGPGEGVSLENSVVLGYIDGTIDANHAYVLGMGEIRITNVNELVLKGMQRKQQGAN
jgi:hypothetical protein